MNSLWKRLLLVGVIQLLLFEGILQFCVHRRESTEELLLMTLFALLLGGVVWALMGACRQMRHAWIYRLALVLPVFAALYTVDYFYSWHVRTKTAYYRQPDWVAQHPGFERDLHKRIGGEDAR